jgi:hypothetical protein
VVDRGGLENRCAREGTVGSNPTPSANQPKYVLCPRIKLAHLLAETRVAHVEFAGQRLRRRVLQPPPDDAPRRQPAQDEQHQIGLDRQKQHQPVALSLRPTASCIKLFILLVLMRRIAAGDLTLEQRIPVLAGQQVGGSGVLKDLSAGIELPLRDVATLMIVLSDNTATNMLVDLLGLAAVNQTIRDLGLPDTTLFDRVDFHAIGA